MLRGTGILRAISRPIAIERMLRHIITRSILLLCLLSAGVPGVGCGEVVPTRDCCADAPNAPCAPQQTRTAEANRLDFCCIAGGAIASAASMAIPSNERAQHWDGVIPPVLLVALSTLTTAYVQSPLVDDLRVPQPLSDFRLYLSTGRLRL